MGVSANDVDVTAAIRIIVHQQKELVDKKELIEQMKILIQELEAEVAAYGE